MLIKLRNIFILLLPRDFFVAKTRGIKKGENKKFHYFSNKSIEGNANYSAIVIICNNNLNRILQAIQNLPVS